MSKSSIIALSIVVASIVSIGAYIAYGTNEKRDVVTLARGADIPARSPETVSPFGEVSSMPASSTAEASGNGVGGSSSTSSYFIPKPDLTWGPETRMVNGKKVTYVFGEGQPAEVDGMFDHATNQPSGAYWSTPTSFTNGNNPYGYVTADFEQKLYALLSDERFHFLVNQCYRQLGFNQQTDFNGGPIHSLNMRDFLVIDPETGRKEVNYALFDRIGGAFAGIDFPLAEHPSEQKWRECLTEDQHDTVLVPVSSQLYARAVESWKFVNR